MTESTLVENLDVTLPCLQALKALGLRLAVDDFGTGYCSTPSSTGVSASRSSRRGKVVAHLDPANTGNGQGVKAVLRKHGPDADFALDLASVRELLNIEERS